MPLAATTPAERVEQLIALSERLRALADAQTEAFNAKRPSDAAALRAEVDALTRLYAEESALIAADPSRVAGAPEARRAALRQLTEELQGAAAGHMRAVGGLRRISEGLVQAIAEHVAAARQASHGYGPGAAQTAGDAHAAITLDRRA